MTLFVLIPLFFAVSESGLLRAQSDGDGGQGNQTPAEDSPLAVEPQTNLELLETAVLMADFGRPQLAKSYLKRILDANLSDDELLELRDEVGSVEIVRMARTEALQPESQQLLDQIAAASGRQSMKPERIDKVLRDLGGSPREREIAISELQGLGLRAMPRLIQHLADPNTVQTRDQIVYLFSRMGREIVPALFAALNTENPLLKSAILGSLGVIGEEEDIKRLWYYAYSEAEQPAVHQAARVAISRILYGTPDKTAMLSSFGVKQDLIRASEAYLKQLPNWTVNEDGTVDFWIWDAQSGTVVPLAISPKAANLRRAVVTSRQALSFSPEDPHIQALYLTAVLAEEGYRVGPEEALPTGAGTPFNLALTSGVPVLEKSYEIAMETGQYRAAETVLRALSLVGERNLLNSSLEDPSPLIAALNAPHSGVQFAAAVAILELNPRKPFRQASRVVEILARGLNDDGVGKVLMIDPNVDRGRTLAAATRMPQDSVRTGKEGFIEASTRSDIKLIMTHINCIDWGLSQTLANFRADARTAALPIVIYGPTFMEDELALTIQRTPNTHYVIFTPKSTELDRQLEPFLVSQTETPLSPVLRRRRAAASADWLATIARRNQTHLFDLTPATASLSQAVNVPELAVNCLTALGAVPTREAQDIIVNVVLSRMEDLSNRVYATRVLTRHMQEYGVLLDDRDIADLKEAWEGETDPEMQTALAILVGSLQPNSPKVTERLERHVIPPAPAQN